MKKEGIDNSILRANTESNKRKRKQRVTCLTSMYEWITEQK